MSHDSNHVGGAAPDDWRDRRLCGKIFPLPGEASPVTPHEFAPGSGPWSGDDLLILGPEGDLSSSATVRSTGS